MPREMSRSEKPEMFAKGGSNKMFDRGTAHAAIPGQSGKSSNGGADGVTADKLEGSESYVDGFKMAEGGSDHMFGKGHAGKKIAGVSGKESQEG